MGEDEMNNDGMLTAKAMVSGYRCQFCGKDSPPGDWGGPSQDICPHCGRTYNPLLAQDEETE